MKKALVNARGVFIWMHLVQVYASITTYIGSAKRIGNMLPIVEIIRLEESEQGTLGKLRINKEVFCDTLEPADRENAQNISSIPAQQYICERVHSPKFGLTYRVTRIPGRSDILFHAGNTADNTLGCILLGSTVGKFRGKRAVLNSGETFHRFMKLLKDHQRFHLTIIECY